jgi:hypothetical protein
MQRPSSYAQVIAVDLKENLVTVRKENGEQVTYDPARLRGISAYREIRREFAIGDRIQLTAPNRELGVANRDLGTLQQIGEDGRLTLRMDIGNSIPGLLTKSTLQAGCRGFESLTAID